jgi:hypothetical protein
MSQLQTDGHGALLKWGSAAVLAFVLLSGSYLGAYSAMATETLDGLDCMPHRTYNLAAKRLPPWCTSFLRPADWVHDQITRARRTN